MIRSASDRLDPQQQEARKKRNLTVRLNTFFFCIFLLFSALIVRLAFLQFVEGSSLKSQENQTTTIDSAIAPIRGNIYDRDSFPIATTESVQSLFYQAQAGTDQDKVVALAKKAARAINDHKDAKDPAVTPEQVIEGMDVGYGIDKKPTKEPYYYASPRRIKANLSENELAYFMENRDEYDGFEIREETIRKYQDFNGRHIAAQLVGYMRQYNKVIANPADYLDVYRNAAMSGDNEYLREEYVGLDGLEFLYQNELRGKNGHRIYPVNSLQQIVGPVQVVPPQKGDNLVLTIQKDVQLAAQQAITDHLKYMASPAALSNGSTTRGKNAKAGYAVAMEVDTGKVVAMASMPDYDPNIWRGGISDQDWQSIQYEYTNGTIRDRYPDVPNDELYKHPTSMVPPGSTLKPLTVLFGLHNGIITPNEHYQDTGTFYYGKNNAYSLTNSDRHAYGNLTAATAIEHSSNTFMASMIGNRFALSSRWPDSEKLGMWDSFMKSFGLGADTGSGLPGESRGVINYDNEAKKNSLQSAMVFASFGQQAKYTTLQLAQYCAMLANHGKRMKPEFVDRITDYDNNTVETVQPQVLNEVKLDDQYWNTIEQGMSKVFVTGFDGAWYYDQGLLERKTGTSQSDIAGHLVDNAVFIAYAPANKPKLAVAVVVPEGGFGSWGAAPIARKIFDAYDKYVGLTDKGPAGGAGGGSAAAAANGH